AKILMLKSEGKSTKEIAEELEVNPRTVLLWCNKLSRSELWAAKTAR
nr:helix-turn-helix domain-containing protein [Clostridia bacterium]